MALKLSYKGYSTASKKILLFCALRNELVRIPFFLEYYRKLGVEHFFFIDNGSTDGFRELAERHKDITVYHTNERYSQSNYGLRWTHNLLNRYGKGKWCLIVDSDEFLVYKNSEKTQLPELASQLETNGQEALFAALLDMYGARKKKYHSGANPLTCCPFFDEPTYFNNRSADTLWLYGGVRCRVFSSGIPQESPALNKIPFIKWGPKDLRYTFSTHSTTVPRVNLSFQSSITGSLLHFKFLSTFSQKLKEEIQRKEHWENAREYVLYDKTFKRKNAPTKWRNLNFYDKQISIKYKNTKQLLELNLIK